MAVFTFIGSLGEAFAPYTPDVPRAVLVTSGVVGGLLSVALLLSGVMELIDRHGEATSLVREQGRTRH